MLFNSFEFIFIFLPIALLLFYWINYKISAHASLVTLLVLSFVFYAYWDWRFLPILLSSLAVNFVLATSLIRSSSRPLLIMGIVLNLSPLVIYKYSNFLIENVNGISGAAFSLTQLALPLAISFFTFQQIAYLVDAYQRKIETHTFIKYALFLTYFPQLIAGPIVHEKDVMPTFNAVCKRWRVDASMVGTGIFLFVVGLFKKVIIADSIATVVDPAFADIAALTIFEAWTATLGYALQLYFDFSAYCEMAMGISLLFGIRLPVNFNSPYQAVSIQDFWQRWHITLGRFLRDYLYIPLGGNRHSVARTAAALLITMLLGGLWHGAGWTYLLWGGIHGALLATHQIWRRTELTLPTPVAKAITLLCVLFAWVMFRAPTVSDALLMWETLLGLNGVVLPTAYAGIIGNSSHWTFAFSNFLTGWELPVIVVIFGFVTTERNVHERAITLAPSFKQFAATAALLCVCVFNLSNPSVFLYFGF